MRIALVIAIAAALSSCRSHDAAAPRSSGSSTPPPCSGEEGPTLTVDQVLALREERESVTVEGYFVRQLGGCTMVSCIMDPNCNSCEILLRLAASPKDTTRTIALYDTRVHYSCWTSAPEKCSFDANGEHVVARGRLRINNGSVEPVSLDHVEICTE